MYPFDAVKDKLQGKVLVRAVISESGDIESAVPISGDPLLAKAAVDAAKEWKFRPYLRDGSRVKMAINIPFAFIIIDDPPNGTQLVTSADSFWRDVPRELIAVRASEKSGSNVVLHRVEPLYPVVAKASRVQGTVQLFVVIGKDGTVQNVGVISGPPLLQQSSVDAVRQWRYKPFLLDGQPIEVQTLVEARFALSER